MRTTICGRGTDEKLLALAKKEITELGLVRPEEIEDGAVVRMPKAYPMYDNGWAAQVLAHPRVFGDGAAESGLVGRNGMHKYNNQDHSMMTALCASRNILGANHDLWAINTEPDYHEEKKETSNEPSHADLRRPAYAEPPVRKHMRTAVGAAVGAASSMMGSTSARKSSAG